MQAVILRGRDVLAWHKAPTTANIQTGVRQSIQEVIRKGAISPATVNSVHIGTTVISICPGALENVLTGLMRLSSNS